MSVSVPLHADLVTWVGIAGGAIAWIWREIWLRLEAKKRAAAGTEAEARHLLCELERVALKGEVARLTEKIGLAEQRAITAWECYAKVAHNE